MNRYSRIFSQLTLTALAAGTAGCIAIDRPSDIATHTESNGESLYPPVSYDGRFIAFYSVASNLVPGDTNEVGDIFVHDRHEETTIRVSVDSTGREGNLESVWPSISGNGRYVVFTSSASNLVPNDTNAKPDVFIHDRQNGEVARVTVNTKGEQANAVSYTYFPAVSEDGRIIAFSSNATNLVPSDTNGTYDVFVHDLERRETTMVSISSSGTQGNGPSMHAVVSGDGRYIAFNSDASNLVPSDKNRVEDVFLHDRQTKTTKRVSVDSNGREANRASSRPAISHDGQIVAFSSVATNLVENDTNSSEDVFVYHLASNEVSRVNVTSVGVQMSLDTDDVKDALCCALSTLCCVVVIADRKSVVSPDGGTIVYRAASDNLVLDDRNYYQDIFAFDMETENTERVSVSSNGREGNRESVHHGVSFDGRYVAFSSEASNLVENDTNGASDVFVRDRQLGTTTRVSIPSKYRPGAK